MSKVKIKKGDKVQVISGSNKGQSGEVIRVMPEDNKLIISGVNKVKKHIKPSAQNPKGGVLEMEAPLQVSNVALLDPKTNQITKVGFKIDGDKKIRISKKSGLPV